jgi:hypothetical protein
MAQKSSSLSFASIVATFTPISPSSLNPLLFSAESAWDEEEFLGEPQPAKETGRRFMARTGRRSVTIFNNASNGTRDLMLIDGPDTDGLIDWAQQINPRVRFNLDVSYQRDDVDGSSIRTHKHINAFIQNTPARAIHGDVVVVKFTINYEQLSIINPATGAAV